MSKNQFRILVLASFVFAVLSGFVEYVWPDPIAEMAYEVVVEQKEEMSELNLVVLGITVLIGVVLAIGSLIGLLLLKNWGRFMYALGFLLMLPIYPLFGVGVYSGLSQLASDLSMILSGVILTLVYYSPVAKYFENEI